MAAQFADPLETARVAAEHQEDRRVADPRHVRDERCEAVAAGAVFDPDHRGLLEIRFRGGRERGSEEEPQQRLGHRARRIAAMGAAQQYLAQPRDVGKIARRRAVVSEAGMPFGCVICAHVRRFGDPLTGSALRPKHGRGPCLWRRWPAADPHFNGRDTAILTAGRPKHRPAASCRGSAGGGCARSYRLVARPA